MFAANMWVAFALQKLLTFFQQKKKKKKKKQIYFPYFKKEILMSC